MTENSCVSPEVITWGEKETTTLIALYELEPCLYDRNDPNYNDTIERNNAYDRIKQVMLYLLPTCTVNQIKNKIRSLCIQFITEKLAKECSIHNGLSTEDTYKPALWCFELLQFLDDHLQILTKNHKSKVIEDERKEFDYNQRNFPLSSSADSEANPQNSEGDQVETSSDIRKNGLNGMHKKDDQVETSSNMDKNCLNGMNDKGDLDETSSDMNEDSLNGISDKDDVGETSDVDKKCLSSMSDKDDLNETSSAMNESDFNSINDKVNNKRKRKYDCLVSSSKTVSSKMLDKEDIFGLYVADEMQSLRKNSLLYLRTKQSILKILTNANFKLLM